MNFTRIKKLEECVCQLRQALESGELGGGGTCMQLPYTYSTLDSQTPAAGFFEIDAGSMFFNAIDNGGGDRTDTFNFLTTGFVYFTGVDGAYFWAEITAQAENAGIYELTISNIDGAEPVANEEGCILFVPAAEAAAGVTSVSGTPDTVNPATGILFDNQHFSVTDAAGVANVLGIVGVQYQFSSTTTAADPGSGIFRTNNNDFTLTTEIYLSNTSNNGVATLNTFPWNIPSFATRFIGTHLVIPFVGVFLVTGAVDNSGWSTLTVQMVGHAADATNGNNYDFQFQLSSSGGASIGLILALSSGNFIP